MKQYAGDVFEVFQLAEARNRADLIDGFTPFKNAAHFMNSESILLNFESLGLISATQVSCFESNLSKREVWFALALRCRNRRSAELPDLPERLRL